MVAGTEMTRIVMASALSRMSPTEQSKAALVQQGVVPPLVSMIASGKLEAKAAALGALQNLSTLPSNRVELIRGGIIPPLLTLLFSVTSVVMSLKEGAAAILANISLSAADTSLASRMGAASDGQGQGPGSMAVLESEDTIFQLLSLLNLATPNIQVNLLRALLGMAVLPEASIVRSRMISLGALDVLIPFLDGTQGVSPTPLPPQPGSPFSCKPAACAGIVRRVCPWLHNCNGSLSPCDDVVRNVWPGGPEPSACGQGVEGAVTGPCGGQESS